MVAGLCSASAAGAPRRASAKMALAMFAAAVVDSLALGFGLAAPPALTAFTVAFLGLSEGGVAGEPAAPVESPPWKHAGAGCGG